jgi:hypothetical protein
MLSTDVHALYYPTHMHVGTWFPRVSNAGVCQIVCAPSVPWHDCRSSDVTLHVTLLPQVALEGAVNAKLAASSLARGELPQGDLIPWTVGQQYQVYRINDTPASFSGRHGCPVSCHC